MQTEPINRLSCAVVGHNLNPTATEASANHIFECTTCHSEIVANPQDEFEYNPFKNKEINTLLQQLFVLKLEHSKFRYSV